MSNKGIRINIFAINDLLEAEIRRLNSLHVDLLTWVQRNHPEIYKEYLLSRPNPKEKRQDLGGKAPLS